LRSTKTNGGKLSAAAGEVAQRIIDLALEPHSGSASVRLRACELVLTHAARFHTERELIERVEAVESEVVRWQG
jgi:hypothetical protein